MVACASQPSRLMLLRYGILLGLFCLTVSVCLEEPLLSEAPVLRPNPQRESTPAANVAPAPAPRPTAKSKGEISFDDLKFDIEKGEAYVASKLTDTIKALDGKKVKLRGFILPSTLFRETNIDEFVLVRDNQECCFGPGAALYDCVVVNLVDGVTTDYTTRAVTVTGTFKLKEYKYPDDSGHFAIFNLQGTEVR
jgi:hypothetical protein